MSTNNTNKEVTQLDHILNNMDKLTKDELAMATVEPACCPHENEPELQCNCTVPFCCSISLPQGFHYVPVNAEIPGTDNGMLPPSEVINNLNNATFSITKCCLRKTLGICNVDATGSVCDMPFTVATNLKVLVTKIFGSISFVVAVNGVFSDCGLKLQEVDDGTGTTKWQALQADGTWDDLPDAFIGNVGTDAAQAENRRSYVFCPCNVCVDKIVDLEQIDETDPTWCENLLTDTCNDWDSTALVDCSNIFLEEFNIVAENCEDMMNHHRACNQVIKISGTLKLGDDIWECCPTPM